MYKRQAISMLLIVVVLVLMLLVNRVMNKRDQA